MRFIHFTVDNFNFTVNRNGLANYSYRIILAGLILVIRYDGPIIIKSEAIKVPAFNNRIYNQLNVMGTVAT